VREHGSEVKVGWEGRVVGEDGAPEVFGKIVTLVLPRLTVKYQRSQNLERAYDLL
jgi:hypothetical protein